MRQETKENIFDTINGIAGAILFLIFSALMVGTLMFIIMLLGAKPVRAEVQTANIPAIGCYKENGATQCADDALITCYHNDIERNIANYGATIAAFCWNEDLSFAQREKGARENKRNRLEIARLKKLLSVRGCRR